MLHATSYIFICLFCWIIVSNGNTCGITGDNACTFDEETEEVEETPQGVAK